MAVFVVIELTRRDPMLDIRLFRGAGFVGAQIAAFAISASIFAAFLYLTLYLQNVLGYSPLEAGLRFLPLSLAAFVVAAISGNLTSRVSARWLMGAGLAIIGVSLLLMTRIGADSGWTLLLPGFVLGGIGIGLTNPALASTAVGVVPPERSGMASGTNSTFRQVGIATGIAGLGALFQSTIASKLTLPDGTEPGHDLVAAVASGAFPPAIEAAGAGGVRRLARLDPHDRGDRRPRRRGARRRAPARRQAAAGSRAGCRVERSSPSGFRSVESGSSRAAVALNDATTTSPSRSPSRSAEAAVTSATIGPTRTRVRLPSGTIEATVARMWLTAESAGSSRASETSHG